MSAVCYFSPRYFCQVCTRRQSTLEEVCQLSSWYITTEPHLVLSLLHCVGCKTDLHLTQTSKWVQILLKSHISTFVFCCKSSLKMSWFLFCRLRLERLSFYCHCQYFFHILLLFHRRVGSLFPLKVCEIRFKSYRIWMLEVHETIICHLEVDFYCASFFLQDISDAHHHNHPYQ